MSAVITLKLSQDIRPLSSSRMAVTGCHYAPPIKPAPRSACIAIYNMCQKARAKDYTKSEVQVSVMFLEVTGGSIMTSDSTFGCVANQKSQ
jgi:hypothetical protein